MAKAKAKAAKPQERSIMPVLFVLGLLWWFGQGGGIPNILPPSILPTTTATAAHYVYEKDDGPVPSAVRAGLNRLNREKKINANEVEDDTTNGLDQVPAQHRVVVGEARAKGLPALVVTAGDKVINVVAKPTTEEQVWEAVK